MSFSSFLLLGLTNIKLLLVTILDIFSIYKEIYIAIIIKKSKSDINIFRIVINT
jgi:hypothetical protein